MYINAISIIARDDIDIDNIISTISILSENNIYSYKELYDKHFNVYNTKVYCKTSNLDIVEEIRKCTQPILFKLKSCDINTNDLYELSTYKDKILFYDYKKYGTIGDNVFINEYNNIIEGCDMIGERKIC